MSRQFSCRRFGGVCGPLVAVLALSASACMVGPTYHRPTAPAPPAFKEAPPDGWKEAQPNDDAARGHWWTMYGDSVLDALEAQIGVSNQSLLAAEAQYRAAVDAVGAARGQLYPSVTGSVAVTGARPTTAGLTGVAATAGTKATLDVPAVDLSYQADVWGSLRRSVRASVESAQASAAQVENVRLILQATLAADYFALHGLDGDIDLFETTVKSYTEYLALTRSRFAAGVASGADVAQAESQLTTARAELTDLGVARAQYRARGRRPHGAGAL